MIDVFTDDLQEVRTLARAAFQSRIAPATLYRWIRKGSHGCRLEAVKIGRKWFTTPDRFRAFVAAQTAAAAPADQAAPVRSGSGDVSDDELRACGLI